MSPSGQQVVLKAWIFNSFLILKHVWRVDPPKGTFFSNLLCVKSAQKQAKYFITGFQRWFGRYVPVGTRAICPMQEFN